MDLPAVATRPGSDWRLILKAYAWGGICSLASWVSYKVQSARIAQWCRLNLEERNDANKEAPSTQEIIRGVEEYYESHAAVCNTSYDNMSLIGWVSFGLIIAIILFFTIIHIGIQA